LPRFVGFTIAWALVSAAWGMYITHGNPWLRGAHQICILVKVAAVAATFFLYLRAVVMFPLLFLVCGTDVVIALKQSSKRRRD